MNTIYPYEAEIERLERLDVGPMVHDQYSDPCYESDAERAAEELAAVAGQIQAAAWSPHCRRAAADLASRAIASADRIAQEAGMMGGYAYRLSR
jgi:hypothetical protein